MVFSESGDKNKCGRCQAIKTQVNVRNKTLEDVLRLAKFPCIYEMCKEELLWGTIEAHEHICPQKTYRCHVKECSNVIAVNDLKYHYFNKHAGVLFNNKLERTLQSGFYVYILIKNKVPYLVYFNASRDNFWIIVFFLRSKPTNKTKYEMKLSRANSNVSITFANGTVAVYNEREHCAKCLTSECVLPHHKFSKVNKKEDPYRYGSYQTPQMEKSAMFESLKFTKIPMSYVTSLLGSDQNIFCTVDIVEQPEQRELNKPKLVTVKEPSNNKLLLQILQCPICLEFMRTEIYTCRTGHIICSTCKPQLKECPTCKEKIAGSRSFALEEIAERVELACQHNSQGCNFVGNVVDMYDHQDVCSYSSSK